MKNSNLKFSYSNQRLYTKLIISILALGLGLSYYLGINEKLVYKPFAFTLVGFIYLIVFIYELNQKYFEITNDRIKIKSIQGKEIRLDEITEIIYHEGKHIFKDSDKSLEIIRSNINKNQISEFEEFCNNLKAKTPFNVV